VCPQLPSSICLGLRSTRARSLFLRTLLASTACRNTAGSNVFSCARPCISVHSLKESCTSNLTDDKTAAEDATTVAAAEESNEEQATKDGPFKEVDCSAEVVAAGTDASQKSADASWIDLEVRNEGTNNSTLPCALF
jgi:hypothetical protein